MVNAAFPADGSLLATASSGRTVRVWDAQTGEALTPPLAAPHDVERLSFQLDGPKVFALGAGGAVSAWDLTPEERPVEELLALARLLACSRIDEGQRRTDIGLDELRAAWEAVRKDK